MDVEGAFVVYCYDTWQRGLVDQFRTQATAERRAASESADATWGDEDYVIVRSADNLPLAVYRNGQRLSTLDPYLI